MPSTLRVAIVQDEAAPDLERGLALTDARAADAARAGAALAVFPETWLPGYPAWLDVCRDAGLWDHAPVKAVFRRMANESVVVDGESGRALGAIAARHGIALVVGVTERVERGPGRGTLFNALAASAGSCFALNCGSSSRMRSTSDGCVRGKRWTPGAKNM